MTLTDDEIDEQIDTIGSWPKDGIYKYLLARHFYALGQSDARPQAPTSEGATRTETEMMLMRNPAPDAAGAAAVTRSITMTIGVAPPPSAEPPDAGELVARLRIDCTEISGYECGEWRKEAAAWIEQAERHMAAAPSEQSTEDALDAALEHLRLERNYRAEWGKTVEKERADALRQLQAAQACIKAADGLRQHWLPKQDAEMAYDAARAALGTFARLNPTGDK